MVYKYRVWGAWEIEQKKNIVTKKKLQKIVE